MAEGLVADCERLKAEATCRRPATLSRASRLLLQIHRDLGKAAAMKSGSSPRSSASSANVRSASCSRSSRAAVPGDLPRPTATTTYASSTRIGATGTCPFEQRDVIEQMLPGDLDVSGWELRKALRLFAKCNLPLNEWLGSPMTYQEIARIPPRTSRTRAGLLQSDCRRVPLSQDGAARTREYRWQWAHRHQEKIFYVMRPLLACRWIENAHSQPPTEFSRLVDAAWVADDERRWISQVLQTKAQAAEAHKEPKLESGPGFRLER